MKLLILSFLLMAIVYFLYQDQINYYIEYSSVSANETVAKSGIGAIINYYSYYMT
jgi:hypothetical protein